MLLLSLAIGIILTITVSYLAFANDTNIKNVEFLSSYGWRVSETPIECEKVTLPPKNDAVYIRYNEIQKEAGLDLDSYQGRTLTRYTYKVLNYPQITDSIVRANVLVFDGIQIGGDIMTVESNGFMHSLVYPR